jgi:hypothetical protein
MNEAQERDTMLRFSTSRDQGLGDALPPAPFASTCATRAGTRQFIGESMIGHTPMGSDLGPQDRRRPST